MYLYLILEVRYPAINQGFWILGVVICMQGDIVTTIVTENNV